jgi:alpha-galactosidase
MSEVTEQQLEDMEALFIQTAASMTSDRGTITLHGLSPSTLYFADRPQRDVGHMEAYAKVSLKKYKPMAARNEDRNVSSGLL